MTFGDLIDQGIETLDQGGPLVLDHLAQATAFSLLLLGVLAVLRRAPAGLRYRLYLLASLKFLLPSVALLAVLREVGGLPSWKLPAVLSTWLSPLLDPGRWVAAILSWFGLDLEAGPAGAGESAGFAGLFLLVWLAGALALLWRWRRRLHAFARAVARGRRLSSGWVVATLERQRRALGVRRPVAVVLSGEVAEPGVWGVLRPTIVLPEAMEQHLEPAELEIVLMHELVHVRRWDNLVSHLHMVLCCLLWFHPLVWWIDRRLLAERELACDDRVLELSGQSEVYARSLLKVLRLGVGWRLAGVSGALNADLRRRLDHIRAGHRASSRWLGRTVLAGAVGLFLVSCTSTFHPVSGLTSRMVYAITAKEAVRGAGSDAVASCLFPPAPPSRHCHRGQA